MMFFNIIVNITILIFMIKTIGLLWSLLAYKLFYKKHFKIRSIGKLNDENYKGKILLVVLLDHKVKEARRICEMYRDILLGYKNVHTVFVTNDQEEIEIKMKHNDEHTTREELNKYIEDINKYLDRRDAVKLIHYPYDNDNKSQMVDYAVKEFMQSYENIDKMVSYIGIFDGDIILEQAFITRFDKSLQKYNYPKILETIKTKTFEAKKVNKIKMFMLYLHNANETINSIVKNIFYMNVRKIFGLNKLLPFVSKINGTFIRMDLFYEEEMLSGATTMDSIFVNYYLKNAHKDVMFVEADVEVADDIKTVDAELDDEFKNYNDYIRQSKNIRKYRRVNKFKNLLLLIHNYTLCIYNFISPYLVFFTILVMILSKNISLKLLLAFIISIYLYSFLLVMSYRVKSSGYDSTLHNFRRFVMRLLAFILYPLYLVYRSNGFIDLIINKFKNKKMKND